MVPDGAHVGVYVRGALSVLRPLSSSICRFRLAWVNLNCHGSDEQMFGAKQQVLPGGQVRLRSRQHLVVLIFRGTTMAEQPVNLSTFFYLGMFSRAEQRVPASHLQGDR